MTGVSAMTRPENNATQPEPVSRLARIAVSATATIMASTEGIRSTVGLVPTATQTCITR